MSIKFSRKTLHYGIGYAEIEADPSYSVHVSPLHFIYTFNSGGRKEFLNTVKKILFLDTWSYFSFHLLFVICYIINGTS
jgi:hypothetical protein